IERETLKTAAGAVLHSGKTPGKLHIGVAQRALGVDPELAGIVDDREEKIADFFMPVGVAVGGRNLVEFLGDLVAGSLRIGPVEADARRAALELLRTKERRQGHRDAGKRARGPIRGALGRLDDFPLLAHICRRDVTEDMRMAALHLGGNGARDIVESEQALVGGELRVKDDLEQEVTKL